jgi:glutathione S-transferase
MTTPILYTFRRCPYAMRARLALASAGITVDLREVVLRDKPAALLTASPKGTVPVLVDGDQVVEESRDIMLWALTRNDPEGWLTRPDLNTLIDRIEGPFKTALDRYKYATRYTDADPVSERAKAAAILMDINATLDGKPWLGGESPCFADMATVTFVRQFAMVDLAWFRAQGWPHVTAWLDRFLNGTRFAAIMAKYPQWTPDLPPLYTDFAPTP